MATQMLRYVAREKGRPLEAVMTTKPMVQDADEILIRLKAIAINPADYKMVDQGHKVKTWPFVPGLDGAGIVEEIGSSVKRVGLGDKVLALFTPGDRAASYQEYAVLKEADVARIPESWTLEQASTLGVTFLTGIVALGIGLKTPLPFLEGGETTGFNPKSVLILGGSSAVGAATVQLLRLAVPGCRILTTSSPRHHAYLENTLGVDGVFDRGSETLVEQVKSQTPESRGVDAIIDVVGAGALQSHIFETLDAQGPKKYAQVWTGDSEIKVPSGIESVLFRGGDLPKLPGNENMMKSLQRLLEEEKYKLPLPVHEVGRGFDKLERGLELMRKGVSGEKLVVSV
ncbi:hypothetical protein N7466_010548 [Penicillium verhagenii]|uniref:uncharacterized protein n=1 Tax=Penicillium verhagenii TaxID=1562060 RepID=UPI00254576B8|nr:uncharacterized protein N7466_010548 [Penicillium verhagenii]KAJ5918556.1 hypothetical protein N7466_010548 [Penicillium verhagenii]